MKEVKLTQEDIPNVKLIFDSFLDCIDALPADIFNSDKFALLVVQALMNLICSIAIKAKANKEELLKGIEQIWNGQLPPMN